MFINFRYHIFTITAIFAALGLGILIGSSIVGHEGLIEEQRKIIENIGTDIKGLREENLKLKEGIGQLELQLSSREEIEKGLLSLFFKESLQGKVYNIYSEQRLNDSLKDEAKKMLELAGAELIFHEKIDKLKNNTKEGQIIILNGVKSVIDEFKNNSEDSIYRYHEKEVSGLILALLEDELKCVRESQ